MTTRTKVAGALAAALALMVGMRLTGQLGSSSPPPDPDLILARSLADDLSRLRDAEGLVAVEQTERDSRDAPVARGSLQSSVIAAQLFGSLGALDETPAWLRDVFIRRSRVAASSSSASSPAGDSSGPTREVVTQHTNNETILVALGCRAIASSCQRVVDSATAILRRPLPAEIRTGGQARQWIMVTDARTRLGLDTTERAKVDTSRETWTHRGAVRVRLAAALCELGQCATGDAMGTGESIDQARQALDAGHLELAMALLRLKGARQDRVSLADVSPVASRLGRFRAAGTSAMFSWSPGGAPSVAATQSVYDAALALGVRASDLVGAATAPTTAAPGSGSRS